MPADWDMALWQEGPKYDLLTLKHPGERENTLRNSWGMASAGRSGCRMAHGPVAGGGAIILAHEQSSRAAGMINLESGQVKAYGAQDERELLVNPH